MIQSYFFQAGNTSRKNMPLEENCSRTPRITQRIARRDVVPGDDGA
jgi:hypothetical protein